MKGICFIEPLFHVTIEGRKTQTRRIMNPQPHLLKNQSEFDFLHELNLRPSMLRCSFKPRYKVGEIVYLKEPYYISNLMKTTIEYKYGSDLSKEVIESVKWKNKLFMPEKYARYFIEITGVRCERLQDISDEDCLKDGINQFPCKRNCESGDTNYFLYENLVDKKEYNSARESFAALIEKINGKGTWESNPYVWVYKYKLLK